MVAAGVSAEFELGSVPEERPASIKSVQCRVDAANREDALARTLLTINFDAPSSPRSPSRRESSLARVQA